MNRTVFFIPAHLNLSPPFSTLFTSQRISDIQTTYLNSTQLSSTQQLTSAQPSLTQLNPTQLNSTEANPDENTAAQLNRTEQDSGGLRISQGWLNITLLRRLLFIFNADFHDQNMQCECACVRVFIPRPLALLCACEKWLRGFISLGRSRLAPDS